MKKSLIVGLIFAFLGVLLFKASEAIPALNNVIINYALLVMAFGVIIFIYSQLKFQSTNQLIGHTVGGIFIFRGLVSIPQVIGVIATFPIIVIIFVMVIFVFHEEVFRLAKLA